METSGLNEVAKDYSYISPLFLVFSKTCRKQSKDREAEAEEMLEAV